MTPTRRIPEPDWVIAQTMERQRRELEAEDAEYEERLAAARRKEAAARKMAKARVHKKPVRACPIHVSQAADNQY